MLAIVEEAATVEMFAVAPLVYTPTITTLYALIEAVQDQVVAEDDAAVTATVAHLCNAGYVKFLNVSEDREIAGTRYTSVVPRSWVQGGMYTKGAIAAT